MVRFIQRFSLRHIRQAGLMVFIMGVVVGCTASNQRSGEVDEMQGRYAQAVTIAEQYRAGDYGKPEPDSLPRLKRYQFQAYTDVMAFREDVVKNHHVSQEKKAKALHSVYVMKSYLAALGATSAYEQ